MLSYDFAAAFHRFTVVKYTTRFRRVFSRLLILITQI